MNKTDERTRQVTPPITWPKRSIETASCCAEYGTGINVHAHTVTIKFSFTNNIFAVRLQPQINISRSQKYPLLRYSVNVPMQPAEQTFVWHKHTSSRVKDHSLAGRFNCGYFPFGLAGHLCFVRAPPRLDSPNNAFFSHTRKCKFHLKDSNTGWGNTGTVLTTQLWQITKRWIVHSLVNSRDVSGYFIWAWLIKGVNVSWQGDDVGRD